MYNHCIAYFSIRFYIFKGDFIKIAVSWDTMVYCGKGLMRLGKTCCSHVHRRSEDYDEDEDEDSNSSETLAST
jgi:hypothetical protein